MSRIRSKNTKIDLRMKEILNDLGIRYVMYPRMFGSPDFAVSERKTAIFCDGDFWHGYMYDKKRKPAKKFWQDKIESNMRRDRRISRKLRVDGWSVIRFWEHDIERNSGKCAKRIQNKLQMRQRSKTRSS